MHVLMSGATGMIGQALHSALKARGDSVRVLSRRPEAVRGEAVGWDPASGSIPDDVLEGIDAVVHLAGEPVASGRWTEQQKRRIRDSRVLSTQLLARTVAESSSKPSVFVSASGIGFYGERGSETVDERSEPGKGFLAKVCIAWEAEAERVRQAGIRVVTPRIGVVLAKEGGALAKMLTPFRLGAGGALGPGTQYMSWVALPDVVGLFLHALDTDALSGPMNVTAPQPVTNQAFTAALGKALHRPSFMAVPSFALRAMMGEMADELLLTSIRALPVRATQTGYVFDHVDLNSCFHGMFARAPSA